MAVSSRGSLQYHNHCMLSRCRREHVHADMKPYVCLSEACGESPKFFVSREDWWKHMTSEHQEDWTRRIHLNLWYCDLAHDPQVENEFSNLVSFQAHLRDEHAKDLETIEAFISRRTRVGMLRDDSVCPLCELKVADDQTSLSQHIGDHLRSLSLLSLPLSASELGDSDRDQSLRHPPPSEDPPSSADEAEPRFDRSSRDEGEQTFHSEPHNRRYLSLSRRGDEVLWHVPLAEFQGIPKQAPSYANFLITEADAPIQLSDPIGPIELSEAEEPNVDLQKFIEDLYAKINADYDKTLDRFRQNFRSSYPRESYNIGIICALDVEKAAVEATFDEEHSKLAGDDNVYSFGRIGVHNVVVACLLADFMGKGSATAVARDMMRSFPIKVGFMVGICGGVWSEKTDIRLGDVIVSQPDRMYGGVVQWDFSKIEGEGVFRRTGTLNEPPQPLLNAVQSLKAKHRQRGNELHKFLDEMLSNNPFMVEEYRHQGRQNDELFEASYSHPTRGTCEGCDRSRLVQRIPHRKDDKPKIHYGNIASSDVVVKDGLTRDRIAREEGILCFEMEAAGLMETFPGVVIRGVCDYADSHKNNRWQAHAAATAACCTKELLGLMEKQEIDNLGLASK